MSARRDGVQDAQGAPSRSQVAGAVSGSLEAAVTAEKMACRSGLAEWCASHSASVMPRTAPTAARALAMSGSGGWSREGSNPQAR